MTPFDAATASAPHKNAPVDTAPAPKPRLQRCRRVPEYEFTRAIYDWLRGAEWRCEDAAYAPYHGYHVRLRQRGDELTMDGVPLVARNPATVLKGPDGNGATMRSEAHALCSIAIRGDFGVYGR